MLSRCATSRIVLSLAFLAFLLMPARARAGQAKSNYAKAVVERQSWNILPNATAATGTVPALLTGLDGRVLEEYDDLTLVEIHGNDKEKLKERGRAKSVAVRLRDEFDKIFLNWHVLDSREQDNTPAGTVIDPPYPNDEQGSWLIQFIGPVKSAWLNAVRGAGVVPVQYVSMHAYIVGARESAIRTVAALPFVQWTSQMHRFLKPGIGPPQGPTVELWIELAQTDETDDAVALLAQLAVEPIETARMSAVETRVQGLFRSEDLPLILAQPLVFTLSERPRVSFSDERAVLGVTNIVPSVGSPSPAAGRYKKWLSDLCLPCANLIGDPNVTGDEFYVGIADSGLDGGDAARQPNGDVPNEPASSGLLRPEFASGRIVWGKSFESRLYANPNHTFERCQSFLDCPDTTESKHDTLGHGTPVTAVAAGDPPATAGADSSGFLLGQGVAPSAGIVVTKINATHVGRTPSAVFDVTKNARREVTPHAYWQNFSLNQYSFDPPGTNTECHESYDGLYSQLSHDFDGAVLDGDPTAPAPGQQPTIEPMTLTVSAGNINQQKRHNFCSWIDRTLALPPATAKNVLAIGGGENVRPDPWRCEGARADDYANLSIDGKHGTATPGWFKPDLIAVSSNIASVKSHDQATGAFPCESSPSLPTGYVGATGTSFAAPIGLGAAVLASRRYSSDPAAASPALVKAMLIAGAKSMRGGKDRARVKIWNSGAQIVGNRVIPTTPNGHYYEVESVQAIGGPPSAEPDWPMNGQTVPQQRSDQLITWRDKGVETEIGGFPNQQQGFGRIHLEDVLSDYPARVYVNEQPLDTGRQWSATYTVHDPSLPVRIALAWSDVPGAVQGAWGTTQRTPPTPLVNDLDLSVRVIDQNAACIGRYVGNALSTDVSQWYDSCDGGQPDAMNNVEVIRFFPTAQRGDLAFTVKVMGAAGTEAQKFSLVVWNAYSGNTPPPATPSGFAATATSTSEVALSWTAASNATSYELQRSSGINDPYASLPAATSPSASDSGRSAATTYLYRVRAKNGSGVSPWVVDAATTVLFDDPALGVGTTVRAAHVRSCARRSRQCERRPESAALPGPTLRSLLERPRSKRSITPSCAPPSRQREARSVWPPSLSPTGVWCPAVSLCRRCTSTSCGTV